MTPTDSKNVHEPGIAELLEKQVKELARLREALDVTRKALHELFIPYQAWQPAEVPRLPDTIIKEALAKIQSTEKTVE